ncbi:hypothetical protein Poli38472_000846 [Pythium oligandrum]|uniref:UDP-N-acetylglucosamine diphosphorylase n=1 Tax=Pythium oligandrum TaxID=41045 RepID=A0A8K1CCE0_PYTOL|nr:hypothetical protein Poli38472_000846 [Pythium oligandrum]|eukprot:TMW60804.1 hypothetical protein Poli38472_000846 [Pythium oligandrum]
MTAVVSPALVARLREKKQDHVLKFYEAGKLDAQQVETLTTELEALDLDLLDSIFHASTSASQSETPKAASIEPLEEFDMLDRSSDDEKQRWWSLGLEAISKGEVCALVMGGGQGTRLGFPGPKGLYNIGLPSEKSLFQIFAERLLKLQWLADASFPQSESAVIPFFVMTSLMNHDETVTYFREHEFFGLKEEQMFFFPQGTLPCLTLDGKLMLENSHKLATASDGNGGIYKALAQSGGLDCLKKSGVKYLHVFSVDNALCKVADPTFMGYCIDKNADCGNKVVWKSRANESVGVVAKRDGKFCVVEYSEMDKAASELTDPTTGSLVYGAANICNHFFTTEFLSDVVLPNLSLEYHVAQKKIPMANEDGETFVPTVNTGIKLEAFIFDTFPLSSRMAVLAVPRETEFAPVKNAPESAVDSPDTARKMIYDEAKAWLTAAARATLSSAEVDQFLSQKLDVASTLEISPLLSYNGEGLKSEVSSLLSAPSQTTIRLESTEAQARAWSIPSSIRSAFESAGQAHVFKFVDDGKVSAHEAAELVEDLRDLDPAALNRLYERSATADAHTQKKHVDIQPLNDDVVDLLSLTSTEAKEKWLESGLDAVARGLVGALVLGGGQGTRLGFAGPKGMYDIGLPSHKTLFDIFAQRVLKVQQWAQSRFNLSELPQLPFMVMTSEMNHDETVSYFKHHGYFGLAADQVRFFRQGTLPCFTDEGKIILETKSSISRASDGNGGIYPALKRSGTLGYLEKMNVQYLHVFSVDNVLCKVADPVFIGYCIENDADCANKVVWKHRPEESVGVFAKKNGKFCVVEYSELDKESCELVDQATGKLAFGAANICNHFYRLDFLKFCCNLEDFADYHVAKKKIPYVNEEGETVVPTTNSGVKLETFIFDVFQHANNMKVLGVEREDEFAPVKNAPGAATDSPDTARHLLSEQCKRWLLKAGATFDDATNGLCEVLPFVSYNGEGLEQIAKTMSPIQLPALIGEQANSA